MGEITKILRDVEQGITDVRDITGEVATDLNSVIRILDKIDSGGYGEGSSSSRWRDREYRNTDSQFESRVGEAFRDLTSEFDRELSTLQDERRDFDADYRRKLSNLQDEWHDRFNTLREGVRRDPGRWTSSEEDLLLREIEENLSEIDQKIEREVRGRSNGTSHRDDEQWSRNREYDPEFGRDGEYRPHDPDYPRRDDGGRWENRRRYPSGDQYEDVKKEELAEVTEFTREANADFGKVNTEFNRALADYRKENQGVSDTEYDRGLDRLRDHFEREISQLADDVEASARRFDRDLSTTEARDALGKYVDGLEQKIAAIGNRVEVEQRRDQDQINESKDVTAFRTESTKALTDIDRRYNTAVQDLRKDGDSISDSVYDRTLEEIRRDWKRDYEYALQDIAREGVRLRNGFRSEQSRTAIDRHLDSLNTKYERIDKVIDAEQARDHGRNRSDHRDRRDPDTVYQDRETADEFIAVVDRNWRKFSEKYERSLDDLGRQDLRESEYARAIDRLRDEMADEFSGFKEDASDAAYDVKRDITSREAADLVDDRMERLIEDYDRLDEQLLRALDDYSDRRRDTGVGNDRYEPRSRYPSPDPSSNDRRSYPSSRDPLPTSDDRVRSPRDVEINNSNTVIVSDTRANEERGRSNRVEPSINREPARELPENRRPEENRSNTEEQRSTVINNSNNQTVNVVRDGGATNGQAPAPKYTDEMRNADMNVSLRAMEAVIARAEQEGVLTRESALLIRSHLSPTTIDNHVMLHAITAVYQNKANNEAVTQLFHSGGIAAFVNSNLGESASSSSEYARVATMWRDEVDRLGGWPSQNGR